MSFFRKIKKDLRRAKLTAFCFFSLFLTGSGLCASGGNETKPWTYWWWFGSAVDSAGIKGNLEKFASAGIGGVHIIPVYGVKGYEEKFISFLSPKWLSMLEFTAEECRRLNMGLDMSAGTGWPFGGSGVKPENSSCRFFDTVISTGKNKTLSVSVDSLLNVKNGETKKNAVMR